MVKSKSDFINREISWLYFNDRVLQEAENPDVPLVERARFLGIFSNNLDEFFRVRVATMKRMKDLGKGANTLLGEGPSGVLKQIQKTVIAQQKKFEKIYNQLIVDFEKEGIHIINENELNEEQSEFIKDYFKQKVRPTLVPVMLSKKGDFPAMRDRAVYLAIKLSRSNDPKDFQYALMEIPDTSVLPRFTILPSSDDKRYIIILDDIIRHCLGQVFTIFQYDTIEAYTIKITRDAELDISADMSQSLIDKLSKGLKKRKEGQTVRLVYDSTMSEDIYRFILQKNKLRQGDNLIPGGRYHNFKDFIGFPDLGGGKYVYEPKEPIAHPELTKKISLLSVIREKDVALHMPYQRYSYLIDILREAAIDPKVNSIKMTLYRVATNSKVINALINAVQNGKNVTVVVELRARFDEENNIYWSNVLQEAGVKVIFGVQGLKVHSKLILIKRSEETGVKMYAHIGTGNFHEGTARIYGDVSLFTADDRITNEIDKLFGFYKNNFKRHTYRYLFVSPFNTRRKFMSLIDVEIKNAQSGKEAKITIKLNNLSDREMILKLYEASQAGVKIDMVIRGICCLIPGVKGLSDNIKVISIVDRFLEHARIFVFHNNGNPKVFISSADWMTRNLDQRSEVTVPILDSKIKKELIKLVDIQLSDNVKARVVNAKGNNKFIKTDPENPVHSQLVLYDYFKEKLKE